MQGFKHRQKLKSPQKEEENETKFPLAFHAEGKKVCSVTVLIDAADHSTHYELTNVFFSRSGE